MQDTKGANDHLLPTQPQMDLRRVPGQKSPIVHLTNPIRALPDPLSFEPFFARHKGRLEHEHDAIHEPVDDFEPARFGQVGRGEVALVAAFALQGDILVGHVAHFEHLDRDGVVLVLAEGLEEAREEGGADDLVLGRFGVGQPDGGVAVVDAVQVCEVLGVRAEDQREDFGPACHRGLLSYNVAEFVDGERLADRA